MRDIINILVKILFISSAFIFPTLGYSGSETEQAIEGIEEELDERWPYQSSRVVQVYRSRFASIDLCTTIKGFENQVEFYVLPAEYCISQALAEQEYGALMRFTCVDNEWSVEGKPLTNERLERYCLLFFDYFVKENQKLIGKRLAK